MKSEMPPEALVDPLELFEGDGIEVWLDGGWGVDALLGTQTRPHKDVEIILRDIEIGNDAAAYLLSRDSYESKSLRMRFLSVFIFSRTSDSFGSYLVDTSGMLA